MTTTDTTPTPGDTARALLSWHTGTDGEAYATLKDDAVAAVGLRPAPRSTLGADGYGMTGTGYTVTTTDRARWRRVYALQYGNAGSLVVMVGGVMASLDTDTVHRLEAVRDAAERARADRIRAAVRRLAELGDLADALDAGVDGAELTEHRAVTATVAEAVTGAGVWDGSVGLTWRRSPMASWRLVAMHGHRNETAFDTLADACAAWCTAVDAEAAELDTEARA